VFHHTSRYLEEAEKLAVAGAGIEPVLDKLRQLCLDDFGEFFISLPNPAYPALSRLLPPMASAEVQKNWTGASGGQLLMQTASFVRQLENNYTRYVGKPLAGARILDFGCGYGRIFRMLYYYAYPKDLWGIDAWQKSLDLCKQANLPGNFALSDAVPQTLPVGDRKFDLIFSLSVFTHLSPKATEACLSAIRHHIDDRGLLVATVRPIEFWSYIEQVRDQKIAQRMREMHIKEGFAYIPHNGAEGETYGDSSISFEYFSRPGWKMLGYDRSLIDPYQVSIILQPTGI